jgi:hypothetical protein
MHVITLLPLLAAVPQGPQFEPPVRLTADGSPVRVEAPGWSAPCWQDVDGDGKKDLVVGQFHDGKMRLFRGQGGSKLAAGEWLQAEGAIAEVPGVW